LRISITRVGRITKTPPSAIMGEGQAGVGRRVGGAGAGAEGSPAIFHGRVSRAAGWRTLIIIFVPSGMAGVAMLLLRGASRRVLGAKVGDLVGRDARE
jgi:hypothetical protein